MSRRPTPLTAADLRAWAAGLPAPDRAAATAAVGLDLADLGRAAELRTLLDQLPERERARVRRTHAGSWFLTWTCPPHRLAGPAAAVADQEVLDRLDHALDAGTPAYRQPPPLRLVVDENVIPQEVAPLLAGWRAVGSVVLPCLPQPGSLRARAWGWPFRVGVLGERLADACAHSLRLGLREGLGDVLDLETDPGLVDLLVVDATLARAVDQVARLHVLANAVLVVDPARSAWPLVDARLAGVRAVTGARVTALATGPPDPGGLPGRLTRVVRALAHGHPLDVALHAAFDRRLLLVADPTALVAAHLPTLIEEQLEDLGRDVRAVWAPEPGAAPAGEALANLPPEVGAGMEVLGSLPDGSFDHEALEATRAPAAREEVVSAVRAGAPARFLQAYVGRPGASAPARNVFDEGANVVDVFVGPEEQAALVGPALTDEQLGFDERRTAVRLTVVLVPLSPGGEPVRAELEVPRTGRSPSVRLPLDVPGGTARVRARLVLLHRNRVVQTALLTGEVDGAPARLVETLTLWQDLEELDQRRGFDAALVLNHDDDGVPALIAVSDGHARLASSAVLSQMSERLRELLIGAGDLPRTGKQVAESQRALLVRAALAGRDLHTQLEDHLGQGTLSTAGRIQIVTARADHFLPLELVYDRRAPDKDARVCPRWLAGEACGSACFADETDRSVVCPAVFWGLSRVIERHYASSPDELGGNLLMLAEPRRARRRLSFGSVLVGASRRVPAPDVAAALAAFGDRGGRATSWEDWEKRIAATATDVLVLMPHTNPVQATLEIAGSELERGYLEREHVTGDHDTTPLVLLLGCDVTGTREDPAGYASTFMARSAAVVLGSLTMLAADHAAALAGRFATLLLAPDRKPGAVGELVTTFRREAVRAGLPAALAVTAYGDADWTV